LWRGRLRGTPLRALGPPLCASAIDRVALGVPLVGVERVGRAALVVAIHRRSAFGRGRGESLPLGAAARARTRGARRGERAALGAPSGSR